jgi:hypothetical protein
VFFFGCLVMLLNVGTGHAAPCTPGTDCYCDHVKKVGDPIYDPNLLVCADFEAPTLYLNQGVGNGPPYYGPWYDASNPINRGDNSYWVKTYSIGSSTNWQYGEPANPTFGQTCNEPPPYQGCVGTKAYDPTDRWGANAYHPALQIVRNGEFGSYIPGETTPIGSAGGGGGPFDGTASLGSLVDRTTPLGILGGVNFPGGSRTSFSITQALAMASNMEQQNPVINTNWKFSEWSSSGVGPGDGIFLFGLAGTLDTTFPFYQFSFFDPTSCAGCNQQATCQANLAGSIVVKGVLSCDANGNMLYQASSADYTRTVDWPLATWGCFQGQFTNWGSTNSHVQIWFTGPAGVQKKVIDITANMTNQNARHPINAYTFNAYANTNSPQVGTMPQGPTARYEDNIHITAGPPPSCAQIGFVGAGGGGPAPSAPTGLKVF